MVRDAESAQVLIDSAQRQPHHVVEIATDGFDADLTNPFLNAVSAGFVERPVFAGVIFDFAGEQFTEFYFGILAEGYLAFEG